MGRKPKPTTFRYHKFKKNPSLLKRVHEKVTSGVWERPTWYEALQRFPVGVPDSLQLETKLLNESRVPLQHPGLALLQRMFDRRPSFTSAVLTDDGKANVTQMYFNMMYSLLEKGTPQEEAFQACDNELRSELIEFEKSLTTRQLPPTARYGASAAFDALRVAIDHDNKVAIGKAEDAGEVANGFKLGEGKYHEPKPFTKADVKAYESEVGEWYDRSKFPWAHDYTDHKSRVLYMGLTVREMQGIQTEMRYAISHRLRQSSDGTEARAHADTLTVRRYGNQQLDGEITLDHHRTLSHCVLYAKHAREVLKTQLDDHKGIDPPASTLKDVWERLSKAEGGAAKAYLEALGVDSYISNKVEELEATPPSEDVDPISFTARARSLHFIMDRIKENPNHTSTLAKGEVSFSSVLTEIKEATQILPLPEDTQLRECLELTGFGDLIAKDGQIDSKGLKKILKAPPCLDRYVDKAREVCDDLGHLHESGEAPQSNRVRSLFQALQDLTDFIEDIMMSQRGRMTSLGEVLEARNLYRATTIEDRIPVGIERRMMSSVWDEVEELERAYLLSESKMPTMTISQFNRLADCEPTLSRILPGVQPVPFKSESDQVKDLLFEVGVGRLDSKEVRDAVHDQLILPARIRDFVLRENRDRKLVKPNLGGNHMLAERLEKEAEELDRYSAYGGREAMDPTLRGETYSFDQLSKHQKSISRRMEARWQAIDQKLNVAAAAEEGADEEGSLKE